MCFCDVSGHADDPARYRDLWVHPEAAVSSVIWAPTIEGYDDEIVQST
jgi:hypothetical protein